MSQGLSWQPPGLAEPSKDRDGRVHVGEGRSEGEMGLRARHTWRSRAEHAAEAAACPGALQAAGVVPEEPRVISFPF